MPYSSEFDKHDLEGLVEGYENVAISSNEPPILQFSDKRWVSLYKDDITTEEADTIINELLPEWWVLFKTKNNEYGTHEDDLGMRGQYADIHRKMKKLRNALWDGQPLTHEQPREVILDLIGHLFLTLAKGDKDGWGG